MKPCRLGRREPDGAWIVKPPSSFRFDIDHEAGLYLRTARAARAALKSLTYSGKTEIFFSFDFDGLINYNGTLSSGHRSSYLDSSHEQFHQSEYTLS